MKQQKAKLWIHGITGKMGEHLVNEALDNSYELLGGSSGSKLYTYAQSTLNASSFDDALWMSYLANSDLIIDFSTPDGNKRLHQMLLTMKTQRLTEKAIVIGTTGLSKDMITAWKQLNSEGQTKLLFAPNTSIGILLLSQLGKTLASILHPLGFDTELIESHHREKIDAPSGTAKYIAAEISKQANLHPIYARGGKRQANEIGIASIRGGSVFGEHTLSFLGDTEEISISHKALSRKLFASGAMHLGLWLMHQKPRVYGLEDIALEDISRIIRKAY